MFGAVVNGLQRIRAVKDFGDVKTGDIGGWIEQESNLSHDGDCWVFGHAKVFGCATVFGCAKVDGNAQVFGSAEVRGYAIVFGHAKVFGCAEVFGNAKVDGCAEVRGCARVRGNAKVYGIKRSDGHTFSYVPDEDGAMRVIAGCRYVTMEEARVHWEETRGGTPLGDETMSILEALTVLTKTAPNGCI